MLKRWPVALCALISFACGGSPATDSASEEVAHTDQECHHSAVLKRIELDTGVELQYLEQGRPEGRPVIFLHGYTDSHRSFDVTLQRFPRRYRALALDMRGHGDSSKPACCYTQDDFAGDVVAFMDALDIERASLVGHSMGSFIAHKVAAEHPDRVEALIIIGSAPTMVGNPVVLELKDAVDTLEDPVDPEFIRAFQASTFYRPIPESILDTFVSESTKVPASVWQQALAGMVEEDHVSRLGDITASALILWGTQDGIFTAEEQWTLDTVIDDSRLIVYRETGHGTHVERPGRVASDIKRFLRRH
jgi:pimeloyl-ACP methyl ester carboxylesterase